MNSQKEMIDFLSNDTYSIIFAEQLLPENIVLNFIADSTIKTNPFITKKIQDAWNEETGKAAREKRFFFDAPGYSLDSWSYDQEKKKLFLNLGATSFKEFIGTFKKHPEFFNDFGHEYISRPIAIFGLLESADGKLVLARRSQKVLGARDFVAPIGGFLERKKNVSSDHLFQEFIKEVGEELGVPKSSFEKLFFTAIVEKKELGGLARFVFRGKLNINADEIFSLFQKNRNLEHSEIIFVEANKESIDNFIKEEKEIYWTTKVCLRIFLEGIGR